MIPALLPEFRNDEAAKGVALPQSPRALAVEELAMSLVPQMSLLRSASEE
jgi:hypothetical protein